MRIKAAVLNKVNAPFSVEELELKPPQAGEVLVRLGAAGVCHCDWLVATGDTRHPLPVVAGHEGAGVVEAVGDGVTNVTPGEHVILNWAPSCGICFYCVNNQPCLCATYHGPIWAGGLMDGTTRLSRYGRPVFHYSAVACFADHAVVPMRSCIPISAEIPPEIGAMIGCAVTTGVGAVLHTAKVEAGNSVAIFGTGGIGLSMVMGAHLAGAAKIIAVDRSGAKGNMAKRVGATDALVAGPGTSDRIRELTEGRGADVVFEATGISSVQEECLDAVRPGGSVVFAGLAPMGSTIELPASILTRQEKKVMGTYYGSAVPARDFALFADLYLQGMLPLDRLVSKTYALEEINDAFSDMLGGELARGVILF